MFRGNLRKAIAAGMLSMCLMLVLAGSAEARQPNHPDQTELVFEEEVSFWHELWSRIESLWNRQSVLIIPEG